MGFFDNFILVPDPKNFELAKKQINDRRENPRASGPKSGTSNEVGKKLNKKGYIPNIPY